MPRKLENGFWLVDIRPAGSQGKRVRKRFPTKAEALRFEAWTKSQATQGKDWNPRTSDKRKLSTLCERWYDLHGSTLKDGKGRKKMLLAMCESMGNPAVSNFTTKDFTDYRATRLQGTGKVSANTVNHEHAYLRAVFNELRRLGEYTGENPLQDVTKLHTDEVEMSYLDDEQLKTLNAAIKQGKNPHTFLVSWICLATGARWGEAESLTTRQIRNRIVTFSATKSGKVRTIPIDQALNDALAAHRKEYKLPEGRYFATCYSSFRKAIKRSGLTLPPGQLSHVLRHTFASHFMMGGGNLVTLQRLLGHSDIKMTMRYAHLAPQYLQDAIKLNPAGHFLDT